LFTTEANKFSLFAPALKGVKKINLLPLGWGEQIDFHAINILPVNKRGIKLVINKHHLPL
jgi:hypothetical protein